MLCFGSFPCDYRKMQMCNVKGHESSTFDLHLKRQLSHRVADFRRALFIVCVLVRIGKQR